MSDLGTNVFLRLAFGLMEGVGKSLTKKSYEKPKYSLVACFVCLLVNNDAKAFCREKTYLSATEGRPVVLGPVVAITEEVSFILWIRDDSTEIATIRYLKESAFILNNGNGDKVNISHDGSLTINNFTVEDQGTYTVMIKQLNKSDCNHTFYVSMSEKSPCGDIREVAGREEEEITLPLEGDEVQVKIVYWLSPIGELLAKTKPGGYIQAQKNYDRRVQTLADSSLTIMKLTTEDQGIYVANVYMNSGKSCSQKYNVIVSGVTPETANMKTVYVYSSEEQEVTLPFPELLMDQVEDVFWMKDHAKHIATTFRNGSLHILNSRYQGRLNSTSDGSLIIHHLRVEDRGKYSADIHLTNKELYTEIYHLTIYKKSYHISLGRRDIIVTQGGDLSLQNDLQGIQSIDWLTPRWIRFAVTKLDGTMCIYNENYFDRLSSLKDGSITIKRVTKKDEGIYRAHMFSYNGTLLELQYQAYIQKDQKLLHISLGVTGFLVLLTLLLIIMIITLKKNHTTFHLRKKVTEKTDESMLSIRETALTMLSNWEMKKSIQEVCEIKKSRQDVCEVTGISNKSEKSSYHHSLSHLSDLVTGISIKSEKSNYHHSLSHLSNLGTGISIKSEKSNYHHSLLHLSDMMFESSYFDDIDQYSTEQVFQWPDGGRVGKTDWCSCQKCIPMATQDESVCCRELEGLNKFFDGEMTCILEKSELTTKFDEQELVWLIDFSRRIPQSIFSKHRNRCLQKACRWSFIHFVYSHFDPEYHLPIPTCVLNYVRKRYPDPLEESEGYWINVYDSLLYI